MFDDVTRVGLEHRHAVHRIPDPLRPAGGHHLQRQPGPANRNTDTATWNTTSEFFRLNRRRPDARTSPSSRSVCHNSTRVECSAGASPKRIPVTNESASAKPSTRKSRLKSTTTGRSSVLSHRIVHHASTQPAAPPASASSTLSVRR